MNVKVQAWIYLEVTDAEQAEQACMTLGGLDGVIHPGFPHGDVIDTDIDHYEIVSAEETSERTRTKALSALDGMRSIVRREMAAPGNYVSNDVIRPELEGALCGGRTHCALGSLWAGYGIKLERTYHDDVFMPGVIECDRPRFLRNRPGLRAAYEALNASAAAFAEKHGMDLREPTGRQCLVFESAAEHLFEGYYGSSLTKRDLLAVIASAKRKIKAA